MALFNLTIAVTGAWPSGLTRPYSILYALKRTTGSVPAVGAPVRVIHSPDDEDCLYQSDFSYGYLTLRDRSGDYGVGGNGLIDPGISISSSYTNDWVWRLDRLISQSDRSFIYEGNGPYSNTEDHSAHPTVFRTIAISDDAATRIAYLCLFSGTVSQADFNAVRSGTLNPRDIAGFYDGCSFATDLSSFNGLITLSGGGSPSYPADNPTVAAYGGGGSGGGGTSDAIADIVSVPDDATITLDITLGTTFAVTLGGNRVLAKPIGAPTGKRTRAELYVTQSSGTAYTLTPASGITVDVPAGNIDQALGSVTKLVLETIEGGAGTWMLSGFDLALGAYEEAGTDGTGALVRVSRARYASHYREEAPVDGTYYWLADMPAAGKVLTLGSGLEGSGTPTITGSLELRSGGAYTAITGLSNLTRGPSANQVAATGANVFAAGDSVWWHETAPAGGTIAQWRVTVGLGFDGVATTSSGGGGGGTNILFDYANYTKPTIGGPVSGVSFAPAVLQPSGADDLVGFNFQNGTTGALEARLSSFGHYFPPGMVQLSDNLDAYWLGAAHGVQLAPLRLHNDGSVRHAKLITQFPALAPGVRIQAMLRKGAAPLTGSDVDMSALSTCGLAGTCTVVKRKVKAVSVAEDNGAENAVGVIYTITPSAVLAEDGGTPDVTFTGKMATQRRFMIPMTDALRIVLDATCYSDGTVDADFEFWGDVCLWSNPSNYGSWFLTVSLTQGGTAVISEIARRTFQGSGWGKLVSTAVPAATNVLADPPEHAIEFDVPFMEQVGAIPSYDLTTGLNDSVLTAYAAEISGNPNWRRPYQNNGFLSPGMGGTGGRKDIGILPGWHADWCMTQSYTARQFVIAQAEAARQMVINYWDPVNDCPLNIFPGIGHPNIWLDGRHGGNPPDLQFPDPAINRDWDGAHQPQMAYTGYLITGRRMLGDLLEKQACFSIDGTYEQARNHTVAGITKDWVVVQENQPRQAGWCIRDVAMAALLMPEMSLFGQRFLDLIEFNYAYLNSQTAAWTAAQGETYGWLAYSNPYDEGNLKPWMQDHFVAGTCAAILAGSVEALMFLEMFARHFIIARSSQPDATFIFKQGAWYTYFVSNSNDILNPAKPFTQTTWAAITPHANDLTVNGWDKDGDYDQLLLRSLSLARTFLKDEDAPSIIARVLVNNPPYANLENYRMGALDNIRPLTWLT